MNEKSVVMVLTGPSGSGKTTYSRLLVQSLGEGCGHNVTYTTRLPRKEDCNSEYFKFISKTDYCKFIKEGVFFCYTHFCGNDYGYRKIDLFNVLNSGRDLVLDSIMNVDDIRRLPAHVVIIYLTPTTNKELQARINTRNPDMDKKEAKFRFQNFYEQHKVAFHSDYIVNTSETRTKNEVLADLMNIYHLEKKSAPTCYEEQKIAHMRREEWFLTNHLPID